MRVQLFMTAIFAILAVYLFTIGEPFFIFLGVIATIVTICIIVDILSQFDSEEEARIKRAKALLDMQHTLYKSKNPYF